MQANQKRRVRGLIKRYNSIDHFYWEHGVKPDRRKILSLRAVLYRYSCSKQPGYYLEGRAMQAVSDASHLLNQL